MASGVVGTAASFSGDGETFEPLRICAGDDTGEMNYCDARFAVLDDGRLLMLLWTFRQIDERTLDVHYCWSNDNGRTWSAPMPTGIPGQVTAPLLLPSGDILIATNHRMPPVGNHLWLWPKGDPLKAVRPVLMWSARDEEILAEPITETLASHVDGVWDELSAFTFGTPDLVNLRDGSVLMTYWAVADGITHVRSCRFVIDRVDQSIAQAPAQLLNVGG